MKKIDRSGHRIGRLTIVSPSHTKNNGNRVKNYWKCRCDCGKEVFIASDSLTKTKSCGCLRDEKIASLNYSHGESKLTKEYRTWTSLKDRCNNKNAKKYHIYGGRGILVCERWINNYSNFLNDMGRCPNDKTSIDRIDVNGNYEPSNCKWANNVEQSNNRTTNINLTLNGVTLTMKQWSDKLGYEYKAFHSKLRYQGITLNQLANGRL